MTETPSDNSNDNAMQHKADQRTEHQRKYRFWLRELILVVLIVATIGAAAYYYSIIGLSIASAFWVFAFPHFHRF